MIKIRRHWSPLERLYRAREKRMADIYGPRGEMPERRPFRWPRFTLRGLLAATLLFAITLFFVTQLDSSSEYWALFSLVMIGPIFCGGVGILVGRPLAGFGCGGLLSAAAVGALYWLLSGLAACCG